MPRKGYKQTTEHKEKIAKAGNWAKTYFKV